jgi:hypothetical protein
MKFKHLVVNGCSYMDVYASGRGHIDLASQLGIPNAIDLSKGGSANSRILRTTLKHSYTLTEPALYILGMTFVSRSEIPILRYEVGVEPDTSFEGRWTNPQNQFTKNLWEHFWTEKDSRDWVETQHKVEVYSLLDRTEDLMYRMLATISDLTSRGHQVIMFQQADASYMFDEPVGTSIIDSPRLALFASTKNIIQGFRWLAIQWQHEQGVPTTSYTNMLVKNPILMPGSPSDTPENIKHRQTGKHQLLNQFLVDYIHNELHL